MGRIQTLLIIFFILNNPISNVCSAQTGKVFVVDGDTINHARDTIIRNQLIDLKLQTFIGKTVREFLQNDTVKLFKKYWWSQEPPGKLHSLNLTYARGLDFKIFVDSLKYQPRFSERGQFNFDKFQDEIISDVILDKEYFDSNILKKNSRRP